MSELESPLWINWNIIGKDFLSTRFFVKGQQDEVSWLKKEVCPYIFSRVEFYKRFSEIPSLRIRGELIDKIKKVNGIHKFTK